MNMMDATHTGAKITIDTTDSLPLTADERAEIIAVFDAIQRAGSSAVTFETKDSGERRQFDTGSQRDVRTGKGRYDLIPVLAMRRWAQLYERGAEKYDSRNWEKGQPLGVYLDSALRHAFQVLDGANDEDHAAAVMWNIAAYMWTKDAIEQGKLPKDLDDLHHT